MNANESSNVSIYYTFSTLANLISRPLHMKEGCGGVFFPGAGDGAGPRGAESSTETSHSPSARSSHCSLGSLYFKVKNMSYADSVVYTGQRVLRLLPLKKLHLRCRCISSGHLLATPPILPSPWAQTRIYHLQSLFGFRAKFLLTTSRATGSYKK